MTIQRTIFPLMMVTLVVTSCVHPSHESECPLKSVEVIYATPAGESETYHYAGKVKASEMLNLSFKVAGEVQSILVQEGDRVKKGQLLAQLDDSDYRIARDAARVQYEQFRTEVKRIRELYVRKAVAQNDMEKAEAGLKQVEAALRGYQKKVDYAHLYAPTKGEIVTINTHTNEVIDAGMAAIQFLADAEMEIIIDVPVAERIRMESEPRIVASVRGSSIPVELVNISPKADNTQLYQVRLRCTTSNALITPGMNIGVDLTYTHCEEQGWVLPISAIREQGDGFCIWTLSADSTVYPVSIETPQIDIDGHAIIKSGIDSTVPIIRAGADRLIEGEKVRVIAPCSHANIGQLL